MDNNVVDNSYSCIHIFSCMPLIWYVPSIYYYVLKRRTCVPVQVFPDMTTTEPQISVAK